MIDRARDPRSAVPPTLREGVDRAFVRARRDVIFRHRRLDVPLAVWRDGKVVILQPQDVPLPELPPENSRTA